MQRVGKSECLCDYLFSTFGRNITQNNSKSHHLYCPGTHTTLGPKVQILDIALSSHVFHRPDSACCYMAT